MIYDDLWWFMMIYDDLWDPLVVQQFPTENHHVIGKSSIKLSINGTLPWDYLIEKTNWTYKINHDREILGKSSMIFYW